MPKPKDRNIMLELAKLSPDLRVRLTDLIAENSDMFHDSQIETLPLLKLNEVKKTLRWVADDWCIDTRDDVDEMNLQMICLLHVFGAPLRRGEKRYLNKSKKYIKDINKVLNVMKVDIKE